MKIVCNKNTLNEAVISVLKAVSSNSSLPVLEGIFMSATEDGQLTLISNDMSMGIEAKIEADVIKGGKTVLNAKILGSIVKNLPVDEVYIDLDEKGICTIKSGNSKFEISAMNPLDFPELPIVNPEYSIKISKKTLKEMITKTIFCASASDNRPILKGCLFDIEEDIVRMVATDGFRLAVRTYHLGDSYADRKFVVPAKALGEINKILKDDEEDVLVNCTSKNAVFIFENYRIVTRLLEGEYINYKSTIYDQGEIELECPLYELFDSVYRASLIITENANDAPVKFLIENDNINISCETIVGKVDDNISVKTGEGSLEIGFFNEFLLGVLRACDDETVKIKFKKNINPMLITPIEGDEYVYLLLPRRLK